MVEASIADSPGVVASAALKVHMDECTVKHADLRAELRMLNGRMWALAIGVIGLLLAVVAALVPHYIGK